LWAPTAISSLRKREKEPFPHEQKTQTHNNTVLKRFSRERNVPGDDFHSNGGERCKHVRGAFECDPLQRETGCVKS
jgi:hypothetical protein